MPAVLPAASAAGRTPPGRLGAVLAAVFGATAVAALPLLPGLLANGRGGLAVSSAAAVPSDSATADWALPEFGVLFTALLVAVGLGLRALRRPRARHGRHGRHGRQEGGKPEGGRKRADGPEGRRWSRWAALALTAVAVPVLATASAWSVATVAAGSVPAGPAGSVLPSPGPARAVAAVTRAEQPGARVLVLRRPPFSGVLRYTLAAGDGPRFPDATLSDRLLPVGRGQASSPAGDALAGLVADLAAGAPGAGRRLAPFAVTAVVVPAAAADPALVAALDAVDDLERERVHPEVLVWRPAAAAAPARARLLAADGSGTGRALPGFTVTRSGLVGDTTLPAGEAGRLLVLAEPAEPGWRATLDGRELPAATAWGWAQAFELPADGGRLRVGYDHGPHRRVTVGCALGLAAVVLLGPLAARGRRGRRAAPVGAGR